METLLSGISAALFNRIVDDVKNYDYDRQIFPVMQNLYRKRDLADTAHRSFIKATESLEEKYKKAFHNKIDSTIFLYMGLCNGAGWAINLKGKPIILVGIEKIVELNWIGEIQMAGLLYHELGHQWHFQNRRTKIKIGTPKEKALWQLYSEGMAMYFEQELMNCPTFYHQAKGNWLIWCEKNKHRIAQEYLKKTKANEDVCDFFGDWRNFEGYSDIGYYLGTEVVRYAGKVLDVDSLINLKLEQFEDYLKKF